jgi:hypothetical protein
MVQVRSDGSDSMSFQRFLCDACHALLKAEATDRPAAIFHFLRLTDH